ncbi:two-component system NarL family sensor kinase [Deinobacterium chartae]|uniref:Two-component system NarL family sensor kinase n=1 Tax=Deinobacterium chartae TaxID=521158 RepID=A0A841HY56_9DEIO|nr:GAF domain-containing sensor histidine kinase [Deinobacterium chartae]MBB6096868.1 two-component system NarL family sensor kinase [Deinobacterium chartae]
MAINPTDTSRRMRELATLGSIGEVLNREADFEAAAQQALDRLVDLLGLEAGWIFLDEGETQAGRFRLSGTTGLPPALGEDGGRPLCVGSCDCQWLYRHGRLDAGVNIVHCSRLESASGDRRGLEVHASVPLLGRAGPVGIVNLAASGRERFDEPTLAFLTAVGRQLGMALERSRLHEARTLEARRTAALEERARLASEMHDSVAQVLFAAELALRVAREDPRPEGREAALERGAELVGSALGELRGLIELLRPPPLQVGLCAALERLVSRVSGSVRVQLEVAELHPAPEVSEALYRIAQEALHNALRHAGAQNVWVRLGRRAGRVRLVIEDDGQGLSGLPSGLGIAGMRARAQQVGGVLTLRTRRGGGLKVEVKGTWPA